MSTLLSFGERATTSSFTHNEKKEEESFRVHCLVNKLNEKETKENGNWEIGLRARRRS
jgi:hypothetical protein